VYTKDLSSSDKTRILSSTGSFLSESISTTKRSKERDREDLNYVPVIIKRHDESKIHPDDILERAINEGLEQLKRPALSLFLSSIAAGLILGFTAMTVAIIASATQGLNPLIVRIAMAVGYPLGFIICITSGTQLFTEHTATAVYPVLDKKHKVRGLVRLWLIVIAGNLVGTGLSASLIAFSDSVIQAHEGYLIVAHHLVDIGFASLLLSAILAGWLMAQGAWMLLASSHQISQMFCIDGRG
jgi:formate/nitrite transporter FocA (FNT family)